MADERTAELDTRSALGVLTAIRKLVESGVTFVLATHDGAVMRAADKLMELDHGLLRSKRGSAGGSELVYPSDQGRERVDQREENVVTVLEARGVSKSYRRGDETIHAVRDVSLTVSSAELVGLMGRSGSGKTTLLNVVAAWEKPDAGHVSVAGRQLEAESPSWSDVAVVPQRLGLMDELSIRENQEYPARLAGRLAVVPQHAVQEVRASLLDRDEPVGKEALMAHPRAKLTPEGRRLLVDRVLELGWSVPMAADISVKDRLVANLATASTAGHLVRG